MNDDYRKISGDLRKILSTQNFASNSELYNEIIFLEDLWKETLLSTKHGMAIFEEFIRFILDDRKNILDARPYFRIRQKEFLLRVNPYIRKPNAVKISKMRMNFIFVCWANNRYNGPHKNAMISLETKISDLRGKFLVRNFPFIINRVKLLLNQYPGLDNVPDLLNAAASAALNSIDKYAPQKNPDTGEYGYTSVLLSTIIGRIKAAVLSAYSNQSVHLYPKDKKRLIEVNKLKRAGVEDFAIAKQLKISEGELSRLYSSFFPASIDSDFDQVKDNLPLSDEMIANQEDSAILQSAVDGLSVIEKKILFLKGYSF